MTGQAYGTDYSVTIPALADAANIETAFKQYHTGSTDGSTQSGSISAILNLKAPLASPTFTGTVTLPNLTVTTAMIADHAITSAKIAVGSIMDEDINASAAIAKTKIAGTAVTLTDTGTVTSTMIADGTIVNTDISSSAAIAQSKILNLTTDLSSKAPIANPTFTGTITGTLSGTATNAINGATFGSGFSKVTVLAGVTGPISPSTGDVWISY